MRKFFAILTGMILFTACGAAPTPLPSPPNATRTATAGATSAARVTSPAATATTVNSGAFFERAAELLATYQPPSTDPKPLQEALAQGAMDFLRAAASPDQSLEHQTALDQLRAALVDLKLPDQVSPEVAVIHLGDSEGGSEDLVFISFEKLMGLPLIAIHRLGSSYQMIPIDGIDLLRGENGAGARNFFGGTVRGEDVTGDGIAEVIYTYEFPGGSMSAIELHVLRWEVDARKFKQIFEATLVNWVGESTFDLVPADKGQNIEITYPWFGIFDAKMVDHPKATETWAYDPKADQFVKQSETVEPAKTVRQQLNVAEDLFRSGDFERAATEYDRAWKDESLAEEEFSGVKHATRAFARFREGQMLALLGRESEAKAATGDSRKAGGNLAKLADAWLKNLTGADGVARAWAALPGAVDLDRAFYEGDGKADLDFPASPSDILFKGEIVAAYLDAHPDAGAQAFIQVGALGFKPQDSSVIDLDGDGTNEYLFVTPDGGASPNQSQHLWLVYRGVSHWLARAILSEQELTLDRVPLPLPGGKGNAIRIKLPANVSPPEQLLTWDGTRVIYLDPQTLKPRDMASQWPIFGIGTQNAFGGGLAGTP
jgi:hypothetical protein